MATNWLLKFNRNWSYFEYSIFSFCYFFSISFLEKNKEKYLKRVGNYLRTWNVLFSGSFKVIHSFRKVLNEVKWVIGWIIFRSKRSRGSEGRNLSVENQVLIQFSNAAENFQHFNFCKKVTTTKICLIDSPDYWFCLKTEQKGGGGYVNEIYTRLMWTA